MNASCVAGVAIGIVVRFLSIYFPETAASVMLPPVAAAMFDGMVSNRGATDVRPRNSVC
jgi:hypothetical protein